MNSSYSTKQPLKYSYAWHTDIVTLFCMLICMHGFECILYDIFGVGFSSSCAIPPSSVCPHCWLARCGNYRVFRVRASLLFLATVYNRALVIIYLTEDCEAILVLPHTYS